MKSPTPARPGFTITEILVVIGVIIVLLGLLFPALAGIRKSGLMTKSMANMRQIGTWMGLYSQDNRDFIVPSQFNYCRNYPDCESYAGKVRSKIRKQPSPLGEHHQGTWADILWTVFELGVFPEAAPDWPNGVGHDYRYDSPDGLFYGQNMYSAAEWNFGENFDNPLRSAAANTRNTHSSRYNLPTPYGCGASEAGLPGYFAANNFFNADPDAVNPCTLQPLDHDWFTNGQIRVPERSMYLVDSFAGETIDPEPAPYLVTSPFSPPGGSDPPFEVDFRYADMCLMLFLDGHVEPVGMWDQICDLEAPGGRTTVAGRGIRIRYLTLRSLPDDVCP
jgi:type II secretory pathway pseudopilin PulG